MCSSYVLLAVAAAVAVCGCKTSKVMSPLCFFSVSRAVCMGRAPACWEAQNPAEHSCWPTKQNVTSSYQTQLELFQQIKNQWLFWWIGLEMSASPLDRLWTQIFCPWTTEDQENPARIGICRHIYRVCSCQSCWNPCVCFMQRQDAVLSHIPPTHIISNHTNDDHVPINRVYTKKANSYSMQWRQNAHRL